MALTVEKDGGYMLAKYQMESEAIYSASVPISLWLLQDLVAKQMFLTCCKFCCGVWCELTHPPCMLHQHRFGSNTFPSA
jgi:hypothetical protein